MLLEIRVVDYQGNGSLYIFDQNICDLLFSIFFSQKSEKPARKIHFDSTGFNFRGMFFSLFESILARCRLLLALNVNQF